MSTVLNFTFHLTKFYILMLLVVASQQHNADKDYQEYCVAKEKFAASCLKNEVIVMTTAVYGRMRMGRCLEDEGEALLTAFGKDPKFIGCSEDVLHFMDKKCSGMNQCEVQITFDQDFENIKPCHAALKLYLEAGYKCVTVVESDRSCTVAASASPLHIVHSSRGQLSCGTKSQPWLIEAPSGQQINVNLLDFGLNRNLQPSWQTNNNKCLQYGYIIEKSAKNNVSICGNSEERNTMVYTSQSNVIELVLDIKYKEDDVTHQPKVLIEFHAIGCTNLIPPEDTWLRRNNNEATVGCYLSRQTWHLRCIENQWTGVIGNCTRNEAERYSPLSPVKSPSSNMQQVTIIVGLAALCLIICVTIICCGAVCLKRHYAKSARQHFNLIEENSKKFNGISAEYLKKPMIEPDQTI